MVHAAEQPDDATLAVWQQRTSRKLTPEDVREIKQNAVGFFSLLQAWRARAADADRERANSPSCAQATIAVAPDGSSEDLNDEVADKP